MVYVRTLGVASIDAGTTHLTPASVRKFALFLYLWAERGRRITRATLHDLIFPDQTASNARHSIRELIYQFRKLGACIASTGETVELAPESVRADYTDILGRERPTVDQLRAARGGFLPGYAPTHSEAFTEWLEALRARAIAELNRAFVAELARSRARADWVSADMAAKAVLTLDPLNEEATLATAELLAMSGSKAQALKLLDDYVEEVGAASPDLRLPATLLKRRISERSGEIYRPPLTLPFLGRDAEMAALQERFARARAGEAQCVVIVGEAGIGKTRLAEELCTQAVLGGASVERVATQPHDVHRPMATFADLVPKLLELPGALGCSPESMTALKRLTRPDSDAQSHEETNSEAIASSIARAIADLVDSIAAESSLLIVVDDAQWIDERSRQTLGMLAAARHARRMLIVVTSRDRDVMRFLAQRSERVLGLPLSPLTAASSREVTNRALTEHTAADEALRDWIASVSGGNPFFLKYLIGNYQATGERFVVPTNLSDLLDQKISGLSSNAAALLGACVALGRYSDMERVVATLEMPHVDLQAAAAELESLHLIVQAGQRIEPAHSLVAETIARSTPPFALRLLHPRVATVLQGEAQASSSSALLWDCAEHWIVAGEAARAADFLQRCAVRALEIGRPRESAELLLRASIHADRAASIALARRATEIADDAREIELSKRAVARLRELGVQIEGDRVELAELNALVSDWDNAEVAMQRLCAWVGSNAPLADRIRAATALIILAEVHGRTEAASEVCHGLIGELQRREEGLDHLALTLLLISSCVLGNGEDTARVVPLLRSMAPTLPAAVAVDVLRKCAVAFWREGSSEEAVQSTTQWYGTARTAGLLRAQFDAALFLMSLHFDLHSPDAHEWEQAIDSILDQDPEFEKSPTYIVLRLELACCLRDLDGARKWLGLCQPLNGINQLSRLRRWTRAAELQVRQLEGRSPSVDDALGLVEHHRRGREIGDIGDFEVGVAARVFLASGRIDLVHHVVDRYLRESRRTRNPLSRIIREAIDSLG